MGVGCGVGGGEFEDTGVGSGVGGGEDEDAVVGFGVGDEASPLIVTSTQLWKSS